MILGRFNINNSAWALIHPNGIVVGPGAVIDASHLLLSTLNVSNEDFMNYYGGGGGDRRIEFTTPAGRDIPAEIQMNGANIIVGSGGIQVVGGTVLLDRVIIRRHTTSSGWSDKNWDFLAVNHRVKTIKPGAGDWEESQIDEATADNLLRLDATKLQNDSLTHNEMRFVGGRVEMNQSIIKHSVTNSSGSPVHEGSDIHIEALRRLEYDGHTMRGRGQYDTAPLTLDRTVINSVDDIELIAGTMRIENTRLEAGRGIYAMNVAGTTMNSNGGTATFTKNNAFHMTHGSWMKAPDGHIQILGGKVKFQGGALLERGKTLEIMAAKSGVILNTGSVASQNRQRYQWSTLAADSENTAQLADTSIQGPTPESAATTFIGGGRVDLGSSTVRGNGATSVAVGARITRQNGGSFVTAPVTEDRYTIDKGTSNFPAHTQYIVPTVQAPPSPADPTPSTPPTTPPVTPTPPTTPPHVDPTTVKKPDSDNAQINKGWADMNQVLQEDAAPEKAAALVKKLNEATNGERTDDAVETVIGYAKAIEGSGLSTAEKIHVFRAVLDAYQPVAEESAAAKAATQAEIDKKHPTMTELLMAKTSLPSLEGTSIDLREAVTGL